MSEYSLVERGSPNTLSFRIYFRGPNGFVSPFHDIPLQAADKSKGADFNMVVEIPRWTNAKMEITKEEPLNPIKQDVKKGKLRYVDNVFPFHGYPWNYGALPQTWENPDVVDHLTGAKGDNDPIDVVELGSSLHTRGAVVPVKVVGVIGLIDEGETDWKILAIDVNDPIATQLNDITDVERVLPGYLKSTVEWLKYYKVPTGKPENKFAFNAEAKGRLLALEIVEETHKHWQALVGQTAKPGSVSIVHTSAVGAAPTQIDTNAAQTLVEKSEAFQDTGAAVPPESQRWSFITEELLQKVNN